MGTSITGADSVRKEEPADITYASKAHIGVFFEGSGLNMTNKVFGVKIVNFHPGDGYGKTGEYTAADITPEMLCDIEQRKRRPNGFTNVSVMFTLCNGENFPADEPFAKIYVEGAGTTDDTLTVNVGYNLSGFGLGNGKTGVTALVSKAAVKVKEYVNSWGAVNPEKTTLHFYVFGFSRGAACARLFCHLLARRAGSVLRCEDEFGKYRAKTMMRNGRLEFLEEYKMTENISVDFLGLYDTVASIGLLRRKDGSSPIPIHDVEGKTFHYGNVYEYGLYTDSKIRNICHLCAMDEFRENFALVNLGRNVPGNAVEVMIPGCHSDVGGSYLDGSESSVIKKWGKRYHRRKVSLNPYNEVPADTTYVDLSSFEELGWVDGDCKTSEDGSQIKMCRPIRRGYSDIPLEMMNKYCTNVTGLRVA